MSKGGCYTYKYNEEEVAPESYCQKVGGWTTE